MQPDRSAELKRLLAQRILILDGAMGTMIQQRKLGEAEFRGPVACGLAGHTHDVKGDNDLLALTQPEVVREIHDAYLAAGADIIETNTFTATSIAQADYGLAIRAREINEHAARIARECADRWTALTPDKPRFVAGALGPTNRTASISPSVEDPGARNVTFDELRAAYGEAAEGLIDGGVDILVLETVFDTLNAKAALFALEEIFERRGERLPLIVCVGAYALGPDAGSVLERGPPRAATRGGLELLARCRADASVYRGDLARRRHVRVLLSECGPAEPDVGDGL